MKNCIKVIKVVGHKFYAPRIGALYHRNPKIEPFLLGGGQEKGKRSGTENTPMIVGLGLAAQLVHENLKLYSEAMKTSRDKLWELLSKIDGIRWLSAEPALPNTLLISIPGKQTGAEIIQKCGGKIFASTGAACHSEKSASAVLTASKYVKMSKSVLFALNRVNFSSETFFIIDTRGHPYWLAGMIEPNLRIAPARNQAEPRTKTLFWV